MKRTKLTKWGNSLAMHLTVEMAQALGVTAGDKVDISVKDGAIIIRKVET